MSRIVAACNTELFNGTQRTALIRISRNGSRGTRNVSFRLTLYIRCRDRETCRANFLPVHSVRRLTGLGPFPQRRTAFDIRCPSLERLFFVKHSFALGNMLFYLVVKKDLSNVYTSRFMQITRKTLFK